MELTLKTCKQRAVLEWMKANVAGYIDPDVEEVSTTQLGAAAAAAFDAYDEPQPGDPYPIPEWVWEMAFVVSSRYEAKEFEGEQL
jgi:hypothetical protein